jgi:hypothetical protein
MNATELTTLSMSELKAICVSQSIEVVGDKRSKATYINAIEIFQSEQTVIDLPLMAGAEMAEDVTASTPPICESIVQPTPLAILPTTHYRGAAIVMLTPLILLSVAVITIGTSISALIPLIAAVGRLLVSIGRSITGTDRGTDSIPTRSRLPA